MENWIIIGFIIFSLFCSVLYYIARFFFLKPGQNGDTLEKELEKVPEQLSDESEKLEDLTKEAVSDKVLEPQVELQSEELVTTNPVLTKPASYEAGLKRTREAFFPKLGRLFQSKAQAFSDLEEPLEEFLFTSDLGPKTVEHVFDAVRENMTKKESGDAEKFQSILRQSLYSLLPEDKPKGLIDRLKEHKKTSSAPFVLLMVGVNGAGKTTTLGKLSALLSKEKFKTLVAAGDTFRAAAQEQLEVWAQRGLVEFHAPENVKDPSGLAYGALERAEVEGYDVVLVDTAGRLHNQKNLMEELQKVHRVLKAKNAESLKEVWLVIDASAGQNALIQAEEYNKALGLTGVVLTKIDGSSKGGVLFGVSQMGLSPIYLGLGEGIEDLRLFDPRDFMENFWPEETQFS